MYVSKNLRIILVWPMVDFNISIYRPMTSYIKGAARVVNLVTTLAARVSAQSRAVSN